VAPKSVGFHGQSSRKWRVDFRVRQREQLGAYIWGNGYGRGEATVEALRSVGV